MGATHGGCRLLYFVKSKKWQEFCCFIVFLSQYIHSFIFPDVAGRGGATAPLATPLNPPLYKHRCNEFIMIVTLICNSNKSSSIQNLFI